MSGQAKLRFLPWVRTGAAGAIDSPDTLAGALAANAVLRPWVQFEGQATIEQVATLRGPGHVTALGPQAVLRTEPSDGAQDFEPNYFPFVELRPADLPWRFTPASPGTNNQLRPWLVLVVVRQQEGVSIVSEPTAKLPVLRIEAPAKASEELPDLADSAAWAHVQTALAIEDLAAALTDAPESALARLICPRHLAPDARWIACLVPAFDVGVHAGSARRKRHRRARARPGISQASTRPCCGCRSIVAGPSPPAPMATSNRWRAVSYRTRAEPDSVVRDSTSPIRVRRCRPAPRGPRSRPTMSARSAASA